MTREPNTAVRTTARSLDIIETLRKLDGARLTEVASHLDLPDSTVHNHLTTLVQRGYVVRNANTYSVSFRFLDVGEYARSRRKIYQVGRSEIDELADKTEKAANLLVEEDGSGVFLYNARATDGVPLDIHPGKHVGLHVTAPGKAILAHLPERRIESILDQHGLSSRTPETITTTDELFEELNKIRDVGYAISDEERIRGVRSIAVAIKNENGQVIGAIGVAGPASQISESPAELLLEDISRTKNIIELKLAHS
ncbi:IclR family transcriptional regulator [Halocatena marina]|uniref:IclR family transcriptional regulator n=1 Tax=Halocatena marina TaxID=2934937 RepID=A0ABD5YQV2_9EURY|nr:IclR family transcriptional regulator [Halocatena marina]